MAGNTNAVSFCVRNCGESMASFGVLRWMSSHCIANNIRHINATATPMTTCDCGETTERIGVMPLLQSHNFTLHGFFGTRILTRGVLALDTLDLRLEHLHTLRRAHLGEEERQ